MTIQLADSSHIPGIIGLLRQVGGVHHEIRPDIFPAGTQKYDEAALEALLKDASRPIFVAAEGDKVLGYCFCVHREFAAGRCSTGRQELYIDDLCVDESCRGRGVATALYAHVTAYAKDRGCEFITLNVWCGNEIAMGFYEKMGLTPRHITMEMKLQ